MFKYSVKIDEALQKEINKKTMITNLIVMIVGIIGLFSYLIISMFIENKFLEYFLWISAFVFAYGLIISVMVNRINKKANEKGYLDIVEINETFCFVTTMHENDIVSTIKVYNKDVYKIRETENYLVIYINKHSAIPVPKKEFKPEELSTIKLWINSEKQKEKQKTA